MKCRLLLVALSSFLVAGCGGSDFSPVPFNLPPTINAIEDQNVMANQQSAPIAFTVTDEQASSLSIIASSDNQPVIPDSALDLGGSGSNRTISVTPVIDALGDAFITIVATDQQGLAASASFLLTIDPQQVSMQQFTRASFAKSADGDPEFVNALDFNQDADDDDFADLLAQ